MGCSVDGADVNDHVGFGCDLLIFFTLEITWSSKEVMGSCCSCPDKETVPDNHRNKFKVST